MSKRGNATAVILIVLLLLVGASIIFFKPFIPSENNVDYAKYMAAAKGYMERSNNFLIEKMLREGFLPTYDDKINFWYCNRPFMQTIDYTIEEAEANFVSYRMINDGDKNVSIYSSGVDISGDMRFSLENVTIEVSSAGENRSVIVNGTFSRGELKDLFDSMNKWMECNAGSLTQNIKKVMETDKNGIKAPCRFVTCSCDIINYPDKENQIREKYGIKEEVIISEVESSVDRFNWILSGGDCYTPGDYEGDFECYVDFNSPDSDLIVENFITTDYQEKFSCDESRFGTIGPYGDTARFQGWKSDKLDYNFLCLESKEGGEYIKTDITSPSIAPKPREEATGAVGPMGYFFYLSKRTEMKLPVVCNSKQLGQKAYFWIYLGVENRCDEAKMRPDPIGKPCESGGDGNGGGVSCPKCQKSDGFGGCTPEPNIPCTGSDPCWDYMCDSAGTCEKYKPAPPDKKCGTDNNGCMLKYCGDNSLCDVKKPALDPTKIICEKTEYECSAKNCTVDGVCGGESKPIKEKIGEGCSRTHDNTCMKYICSSAGKCDQEQIWSGKDCGSSGCLTKTCNTEGTCISNKDDEKCNYGKPCKGLCLDNDKCQYTEGDACTTSIPPCSGTASGACDPVGNCITDMHCCSSDTGNQKICTNSQDCCKTNAPDYMCMSKGTNCVTGSGG